MAAIVVSPLLGAVLLLQLAFSSEDYENDMGEVDAVRRRRLSYVAVLGVTSSSLLLHFFLIIPAIRLGAEN